MSGEWQPIPDETPIDPSDLKVKGVTTRSELNRLEASNLRKPMLKYFGGRPNQQMAPFDLEWSRGLHGEMFGDVWLSAGTFRRVQLNIGIDHSAIAANLAILLDDLQSWPGCGMDWGEQAARLHYRAVHIHPFLNGNGRWSRLMANIWLALHGQSVTAWPEQTISGVSTIRAAYIAAIKTADGGDLQPLIEMHCKYSTR